MWEETLLLACTWEEVTGSSEDIFRGGVTQLKLFPAFHTFQPQQ